MPDLKVTDAELDAVRARLDDAALTTMEMVSLSAGGLGSDVVEAAFTEVDSVVATVSRALAAAASAAATATANAADVLEKSDNSLAGSAK